MSVRAAIVPTQGGAVDVNWNLSWTGFFLMLFVDRHDTVFAHQENETCDFWEFT
jgi:hypothetical protein